MKTNEWNILRILSGALAALIIALAIVNGHYGIGILMLAYALAQLRLLAIAGHGTMENFASAMEHWILDPHGMDLHVETEAWQLTFSKLNTPEADPISGGNDHDNSDYG